MSHRLLLLALASSLASGIAVLGSPSALAAGPAPTIVRIGFVRPESRSTRPRGVDVFWQRLRELGWVEGQNWVIELRFGKRPGGQASSSHDRSRSSSDAGVLNCESPRTGFSKHTGVRQINPRSANDIARFAPTMK